MNEARYCASCGGQLQAPPVGGLCPGCLLRAGMQSEPPGAGAGETVPSPAELQPLFPDLELLALAGQGGMGAVYRARQRRLDRVVALKILQPVGIGDPAFADRFAREARVLARLNHPNIVTVHEFGQAGDFFFLLMEYVDGASVRQAIDGGSLSPEQALAIVPQICDALQYAHDQGVVHRDIKPGNILLDRAGRVKIADFGLAKVLAGGSPQDATLTGTRETIGTPRYMAPEQLEGARAVDHRADIYSLGIVFYEMLTGELPLGRFDPPSSRTGVDVRLDEVVLKALARAPEQRYQTVREVRAALEAAQTGESAETPRPEYTTGEAVVDVVLSFAVPVLVAGAVWWSDSWWPVLGLLLPGCCIGFAIAQQEEQLSNAVLAGLSLTLCLAALGIAVYRLESAKPLWGLLVLFIALVLGMEDYKKRQSDARQQADVAD